MTGSLQLRRLEASDAAFSYAVYASTRADEMALVPWTQAQKDAFLQMQFDAQRQHYREHYRAAEYYVIQRDGAPIGRLIVDRQPGHILLMDIALLPEHRGCRAGTMLMADLMAEAKAAGKPLRLHVETFNWALGWYERLGFVKVDELGVYHEMEWRPASLAESH